MTPASHDHRRNPAGNHWLSAVIRCCDRYFRQTLVHTGQNWDYTLHGIFFQDLGLRPPDRQLHVAGSHLGQTLGNVLSQSYQLLQELRPDAVLLLGDTNSCLSAISAKRLQIPIFHMEAETAALTAGCRRKSTAGS